MRERTRLADAIERQHGLERELEDNLALAELAEEEGDSEPGRLLGVGLDQRPVHPGRDRARKCAHVGVGGCDPRCRACRW